RVAIEAAQAKAVVDRIGSGGALELAAVLGDQLVAVGLAEDTPGNHAAAQHHAHTAIDLLRPLAEIDALAGAAAVAQAEDAVGEQGDGEAAALIGARRLARPADGM